MLEIIKAINDNFAALSTLVSIIFGVLGFVYKGYTKINKITKVVKSLEQVPEHILAIRSELTTNGGSSLRDSINRIEDRQAREGNKINVIIQSYNNASFETNEVGDNIAISDSYAELLKVHPNELLGKDWKAFIHPKDREETILEWKTCVDEHRMFDYKFRYIDSLDQSIPVHVRATPSINNQNKIIGWFGIIKVLKEIPKEWQD